MTELEQNLNYMLEEKERKVIPDNIKEGVSMFGVKGVMKEYKEFTRLQYITFSAENCLNTLYPLWQSNNWKIEYKLSFAQLYNYNHLFSIAENDTKNEIWVDSTGALNIRITNDSTAVKTDFLFEADTSYTIVHECIDNIISTYINNELVNTYDCSLSSHIGLNLRFGRRTSSGQFLGDLYYLKIYDNNTLIRDFIPVLDVINNKAVMYEKLEKQYYESLGTYNFTAGPEKPDEDTTELMQMYDNCLKLTKLILLKDPILTDLGCYYKGNSVTDLSGNNCNGTLVNTTSTSEDYIEFSSNYARASTGSIKKARGTFELYCSVNADYTPLSSNAWYNCSCILGCELGGTQQDFGIIINSAGNFAIGYDNSSIAATTIKANDGQNHHLVLVVEDTFLKLYIDGVLATEVAYSMSGDIPELYGIFWNRSSSNTCVRGKVYMVRYYTRSLTDAEIDTNYICAISGVF